MWNYSNVIIGINLIVLLCIIAMMSKMFSKSNAGDKWTSFGPFIVWNWLIKVPQNKQFQASHSAVALRRGMRRRAFIKALSSWDIW